MDISSSIEARSDQINADDLIGGPATYTIREVRAGVAESPFDFHLVETERAYRPSKTMRRVIVAAWGVEASAYAGRRLTLYREPSIMFGGQKVGGIRISAMSGIPKRVEVLAQVTRGKREKFAVDPLPDAAPTTPPEPTAEQVNACTDLGVLDRMWQASGPERRAQIDARRDALAADTTPAPADEPTSGA